MNDKDIRSVKSGFFETKNALGALCLISVAVRGALFLTQPAVIWPDSVTYYEIALKIAKDLDFSSYPIYRTPLYPLFLSLFLQFGETSAIGKFIIFAQQLLGIFSVIFLYLTVRRWRSKEVAFVVATIFSLFPLQLYYELVIQTEVLFEFLFIASMYYTAILLEKHEHKIALGVGLLLGVMALTRPTAQLYSFVILATIFLSDYSWKKTFRIALCLFIPSLLVTFPWFYWNHLQKGYFGLSREIGLNMYHRIINIDQLEPPLADIPPEIRNIFKKDVQSAPSNYFTVWHRLRKSGYSEQDADRLLARTAGAALRAHPGAYLTNTGRVLASYLFSPASSISICIHHGVPFLCSARRITVIAPFTSQLPSYPIGLQFLVRTFFTHSLTLLFPMTLCAIPWMIYTLCCRRRSSLYLYLALSIAYFAILTSFFNCAEDRFQLPIDPMLIFLFVDCISQLAHRIHQEP